MCAACGAWKLAVLSSAVHRATCPVSWSGRSGSARQNVTEFSACGDGGSKLLPDAATARAPRPLLFVKVRGRLVTARQIRTRTDPFRQTEGVGRCSPPPRNLENCAARTWEMLSTSGDNRLRKHSRFRNVKRGNMICGMLRFGCPHVMPLTTFAWFEA